MAKRTRRELREAFKTGAQPTGTDFQNLIESAINSKDDGIEKQGAGLPLKIESHGSSKNLLDFYDSQTHTWRINQNPAAKSGLNIEDANSRSRLFIRDSDGNIGISTTQPKAKLHVMQTDQGQDSLRVDDQAGDSTPFVITGGGVVGIGTGNPDSSAALDVSGFMKAESLRLKTGVTINKISETTLEDNAQSVATESAVKSYIDGASEEAKNKLAAESKKLTETLAFPKGGIIMWSGTTPPAGWALCNGENGTPDLRGRFVLGLGQGQGLTNRNFGEREGEETHSLTKEEIPAHSHTGTAKSSGSHRHSKNTNNQASDDGDDAIAWENCDGSHTNNRTVYTNYAGTHEHTIETTDAGGGQNHNNMPPYHVLAYIMKL